MPASTFVEFHKGTADSDEGEIWINPEHIAFLLPLPYRAGTAVHLNTGSEKPTCLYVRETPNVVLYAIAQARLKSTETAPA